MTAVDAGKVCASVFQRSEYKRSLSPERHILALQARFGNGFGFVVFGSAEPGLLERNMQLAVAAGPRADGVEPFRILQSPTLPGHTEDQPENGRRAALI
jgi:hypothetical protein